MSDKKKYLVKDDKALAGVRVEERDDIDKGRKYTIINDDGALGGKKIVKRNNGGMVSDYIKDLIK